MECKLEATVIGNVEGLVLVISCGIGCSSNQQKVKTEPMQINLIARKC